MEVTYLMDVLEEVRPQRGGPRHAAHSPRRSVAAAVARVCRTPAGLAARQGPAVASPPEMELYLTASDLPDGLSCQHQIARDSQRGMGAWRLHDTPGPAAPSRSAAMRPGAATGTLVTGATCGATAGPCRLTCHSRWAVTHCRPGAGDARGAVQSAAGRAARVWPARAGRAHPCHRCACDSQSVLAANDDIGCLRWARCAIDIVRAAAPMCPGSVGAAAAQALARMQRRCM